jgi:hypothetical protein
MELPCTFLIVAFASGSVIIDVLGCSDSIVPQKFLAALVTFLEVGVTVKLGNLFRWEP